MAILALAQHGVPIKQIVRETGHSRKLVRQVIRGERTDVFRMQQSSLEPHLPWLDAQWDGGSAQCYGPLASSEATEASRGSLRVIGEWATPPQARRKGGC